MDSNRDSGAGKSSTAVISEILRSKTLEIMKIRTKENVFLNEVSNKDDFLYGPMMAFVLVHGDAFRITFKVHYFLKTVKVLASILMGRPISEMTNELTKDFMKEFCNLIGGEIRAAITRLGVRVGVTLPFVISGFDEVLFSDEVPSTFCRDYWQLQWSRESLVCSSVIEIQDEKALEGLSYQESCGTKSVGEIVFL